MNKQAFLSALRTKLSHLPQEDIEEQVSFYSEMIDDHMEEGLSEVEAVQAIGDLDAILSQTNDRKIVDEPSKGKISVLTIVLLVLGSPVWISLLAAVFAGVFSIYLSWWAVIVSLWSIFGAAIACAFAGVLGGAALTVVGKLPSGLAMIGAGLVCGGVSILLFYGCKLITSGTLLLTRKLWLFVKKLFAGKETV